MFYIKLKQFLKNPVMVLSIVVFFAWIWKHLKPIFSVHTGLNICSITPHPLFLIPISFVFFMFVSYSFFSKDKLDKLDETIAAVSGGRIRNYLAGFFVVCTINLLLLAGLLAYHMYGCRMSLGYHDLGIILFGLKCYVVHIFLVNVFAVLVGLAATFCKSEAKAYALMIVVNCFFSQFFLSTLYTMAGADKTAYQVADLFGLTTRMYNAASDEDYVISIEGIEWQRILFWIFLVLTVVLFHMIPKKKKIVMSCTGGMAVLCLCLYMLPNGANHVDVESRQDAWNEEGTYYEEHPECVGTYENYLPMEDFHITKYVADLKAERVLTAEVDVYVDAPELEEYVFALRHEYKVTDVRDERGQKVSFTQKGDRVVLHSGNEVSHTCFTFRYHGASKQNLSTSQAIRLPANFAYLPFSGERYLYFQWKEKIKHNDLEEQLIEATGESVEDTETTLYDGPALEGLGYETEYDIKVKCGHKVYCNLPKVGENHFQGRSDGATLAANAFLREKEIAGATLIYSIAGYRYAPTNADSTVMEDWEIFIRENGLQGKMLFYNGAASGLSEWHRFFGKDHLMLQFPCTDAYQWFLETGKVSYNDCYLSEEQKARE